MSVGKRILLAAVAGGAAAAAATLVAMALGSRHPERTIAPAVAAAAVGASMSGRKKSAGPATDGKPAPLPQIVGAECAICHGKIVFASDGTRCAVCAKPAHRECVGPHTCAPGTPPTV